jgi:hypothetical protein
MGLPPIQKFQTALSSIQTPPPANQSYTDPRLPTVQARRHPQIGVDTLSYLDRSGKTVFIQRPCQHCDAAGKKNAWHFDFSCADKPVATRRARTYAGETELPGTFDSPSGYLTLYTFNGFGDSYVYDPQIEDNPFSMDDITRNGGWNQ